MFKVGWVLDKTQMIMIQMNAKALYLYTSPSTSPVRSSWGSWNFSHQKFCWDSHVPTQNINIKDQKKHVILRSNSSSIWPHWTFNSISPALRQPSPLQLWHHESHVDQLVLNLASSLLSTPTWIENGTLIGDSANLAVFGILKGFSTEEVLEEQFSPSK